MLEKIIFLTLLCLLQVCAQEDSSEGSLFTIEISPDYQALLQEILANLSATQNLTISFSDFNECEQSISPCHESAYCTNTNGSHNCTCHTGYEGDGTVSCMDTNECDLSACDTAISNCSNSVGSYTCQCLDGYVSGDADNTTCVDLNECIEMDSCPTNFECVNNEGSYVCQCFEGFELNVVTDECEATDYCAILGLMQNTLTPLFQNLNNGLVSEDVLTAKIDEFKTWVTPMNVVSDSSNSLLSLYPSVNSTIITDLVDYLACDFSATCVDSLCTCKSGFDGDGYDCYDVDECSLGTHSCADNANCLNNIGSFHCYCKKGYFGTGQVGYCNDVDEMFVVKFAQANVIFNAQLPYFINLAINDSRPAGVCAGGLQASDCGSSCPATCDDPSPMCMAVCVPDSCDCPSGTVKTHAKSTMCVAQGLCADVDNSVVNPTADLQFNDVSLKSWLNCIVSDLPLRDEWNYTFMYPDYVAELFSAQAYECIEFPNPVDNTVRFHFVTLKSIIDAFVQTIENGDYTTEDLDTELTSVVTPACVDDEFGDFFCPDTSSSIAQVLDEFLPCVSYRLKNSPLTLFTDLKSVVGFLSQEVFVACINEAGLQNHMSYMFLSVLQVFESAIVNMTMPVVEQFPEFESLVYPPPLSLTLLTRITPQSAAHFGDFIDYDAIHYAIQDYNYYNPISQIYQSDVEVADDLMAILEDMTLFDIIKGDPYNATSPFSEIAPYLHSKTYFVSFFACHPLATGENHFGGYECVCQEGYQGDGRGNDGCTDYDECYDYPCVATNSECVNTEGSYTCVCSAGYSGDGETCVDVDECLNADDNKCHINATCSNTDGWYSCMCPFEMEGNGYYCFMAPYGCAIEFESYDEGDTYSIDPCTIDDASLSCLLQTNFSSTLEQVFNAYGYFFEPPVELQDPYCDPFTVMSSFQSTEPQSDELALDPFAEVIDAPPIDVQDILADDLNNPSTTLTLAQLLASKRKKRYASFGGPEPLCMTNDFSEWRSHGFLDDEGTEQVELVHADGRMQWFSGSTCSATECLGSRISCVQQYTPHKAIAIREVEGKPDVFFTDVYIEDGCMAVFNSP